MIALLFALTLFAQGATTLQSDNGSITGVLKTSTGQPAVGVRVSAMAIPESPLDAVAGAAMTSLVATDEVGRYRLENIPPGRYYVTAGRVDFPTYFPGALDRSAGTIVSVTAKATISDLNFALQDASIRTAATDSFLLSIQPALSIPILVRVENGGKQPVSADGNYVIIRLTRTADGLRSDIPLSGPAISAAVNSGIVRAEYRITVDNLPDRYVLKSLSFGSTNLMTETLKLTAANFLQPSNSNPALTTNGLAVSINGATYTINFQTAGGAATSLPISAAPLSGVSTNAINVTLGVVPPSVPSPPGARVTGRAPVDGAWAIYRGDTPGTFYADGTFELNGVPPGRHILVLQDNSSAPRFYAAVVNVDDRDLDGVVMESTGILPSSLALQPTAASSTPGATRPLAGLVGRVVEEDGVTPVSHGSVTVLGRTLSTISVGRNGEFIIPHLLPGSYDLRVEVFEHFTLYKTVVISDQDTRVDFPVRSNLATAEERAILEAESQR